MKEKLSAQSTFSPTPRLFYVKVGEKKVPNENCTIKLVLQ